MTDTNSNNKISNYGKLFAVIASSKMISYYNLPTTIMALSHMAAEDFWLKVSSLNSDDFSSLNMPNFEGLSNVTFPNLNVTFPNLQFVNDYTDYVNNLNLLYLVYTVCFIIMIFYLLKEVYRLVVENIFLVNIFYRIKNKFVRNYKLTICDPVTLKVLVNNHLLKHNMFCTAYDRTKYFQHEYSSFINQSQMVEELSLYQDLLVPDLDIRYHFYDHIFGVSGFLLWSHKDISINVTRKTLKTNDNNIQVPYVEDVIQKTRIPILTLSANKNIEEYLNMVNAENNKSIVKWTLYFCRLSAGINKDAISSSIMKVYNVPGGQVYSPHDLTQYFKDNYLLDEENTWIKTFFHPCIREIWPKLKAISFTPDEITKLGQYAQSSYCFYGPPGTGKSSLVFRVARSLGRDIISINLLGIKTTKELYSIIHGTTINIPNPEIPGNIPLSTRPSTCVFVFDEFDKALLALKAKSDLKAKQELERFNRLTSIASHAFRWNKRRRHKRRHSSLSDEDDEAPSKDEKNNSDTDAIKKAEEHKEANNSDADVKKAIQDLVKADEDELTIDSLLELLQGPRDNSGAIVIAITNNYKEICSICPRLFRDGRLKPVFIGYPTKAVINDITKMYYNREIMDVGWIPNLVRISTSRLLNKAVDIYFSYPKEKQFDIFMENLKYDLDNYKLSDKYVEFEERAESDLISNDSTQN